MTAVRLALVVFAAFLGCGAPTAPAIPLPPSPLVPLQLDGAVVAELSGAVDTDVTAGGTYARFTARRNALVRLTRPLTTAPRDIHEVPPRSPPGVTLVIDGRVQRFDRFDVCADPSILPRELHGHQVGEYPATVVALGKTLSVDSVELCFAQGALDEPYTLVSAHLDTNGLRVHVELRLDPGSTAAPPVRLWSVPPRPENELLAAFLH
jgi:hypothetical protein